MKIEIWSDFACPFCYIGKKRFETALNQFSHKDQVEVVYKAYQLNPNAPKVMTTNAYEAFAKSHGTTVDQAKQRFSMFTENAKTVGLTYNYDIIQMTNTFEAHRLHKWASTLGKGDILNARLMKAYFTDGLNLADTDTLVKLAIEVGLDGVTAKKVLNSTDFRDQVINEQAEARQIGVQGVPFFVINRKYGVSGAQDTNYFLQTLNQIWQEENPIQVLKDQKTDHQCDDETCSR